MSIASDKPQLSGYGRADLGCRQLFPAQGAGPRQITWSSSTNRWVEFSHGFVEFLAMPTLTHQLIAHLLLSHSWRRLSPRNGLGTVLAGPYTVRLWEGKYREPDVAVHASGPRYPA